MLQTPSWLLSPDRLLLAICSSSNNYRGSRATTGAYTITFPASSCLSTANLDNAAVMATLYDTGPPGYISLRAA